MATRDLANARSSKTRPVPLMQLHPSVRVNKSGLLFSDATSLSSWEDIGRQITSIVDSSAWWIADWLVYGEDAFKDRYAEAIARTNLNYQTLRNYAWVARRFSHARRRDKLSFGHHSEVAALDPSEQDYWLRKAEKLEWSRNHLRSQVRNSLRERNNPAAEPPGTDENRENAEPGITVGKVEPTPATSTLRLVLTSDQIMVFERTADAHNMDLHEWAIGILESAARSRQHASRRRGARR